MPVFSTIGTVFFETLLAVISVAAFAILSKEYATRRDRPLLFYCLAFLAEAASILTLFGGHVLAANGHEQTALDTLRMSSAFTAVCGFFLTMAFLRHAKKRVRVLLSATCAALTGYGIYSLAMLKPVVTQASGVAFIVYDARQLFVIYASLVFAILCLFFYRVVPSLIAQSRGEKMSAVQRLLMNVALFGTLFFLLIEAATVLQKDTLVLPALVAYLLFLFLTFAVAVTEEHPDKEVRKNPLIIFKRSLVLKAVSLNAIAIWALSIGMLAAISSLFVQNAVSARHIAMQRDLHYFAQAFRVHQLDEIEVAERFGRMPEAAAAISGMHEGDRMLVSAAADLSGRTRGTRVFDLVDRTDIVRFSTRTGSAIGQKFAASWSVSTALEGEKQGGVEKDEAFDLWVVRAAVPVRAQDGSLIGVSVVTDIDSAFNFSDYTSIAPVSASGYGFVAENGDPVFSTGAQLDSTVRAELRRHVLPSGISSYDDGQSSFFLERSLDSEGSPNGYFYTFVADSVVGNEAFRIISLTAILMLFAVILMTAILLMSMSAVLRPLHELRAASLKVENDQFDARIKYGSPDELGQLAVAFNRMLDTIGDKTLALKGAVRERQDFFDHATRELRTPLNIFRWTLEMMRFGNTGTFNKEQMELIERLHQTNERLTKLVQNLQDVTQIDRGQIKLMKKPLAIEDVIDVAAGLVAVESRKKGIRLQWNRPKEGMPLVPADAVYLEKVMLNLVANAVKYTQQKGFVEILVEEVEGLRQDGRNGKFVKVTVKDNGIGIPTDDTGRVFSRFFRAKNITGFEIEGTGLGLYMVKRLVELHGGQVRLESREGVGTTVSFTLPVEVDESPKKDLAIVNS